MERIIDTARELYENDKIFLKMPQKILFNKYIHAIEKYSKICDRYHSDFGFLIDDLIMMNNLYKIRAMIRYSFNDTYVLDIDKEKFNNAKLAVKNEINRIQLIINNIISLKENYNSNYSVGQLEEQLGDNNYISEIVDLDKKIKKDNNKVVVFEPSNRTTNEKVLSKKEDNVIMFSDYK